MPDYIIVGAGSGGAVLANRLSADPAVRVTVIEAGGMDRSPLIHMPGGYLRLMQTGQLDWGYHSVPQRHVNGRVLFMPRAKSVGGCTTLNGLVYARGDRTDYDGWARLGNRGWGWEDVLPFFRKSERWAGGGDPSAHGSDGPLGTGRRGIRSPVAKAWIEAAQQAGYRYNDDTNAGDQEGFGPCDSNVEGGVRQSVSRCFLTPIRKRRNLSILTKALACRIILEQGRAVGVEYIQNGAVKQVRAEREVIVAGGVFNSPHLLQVSGIGDPDHLTSVGIRVEHALPGVGRNLQDHVGCGLKVRLKQPLSALRSLGLLPSATALFRYLIAKSGPASFLSTEALAFVRTRADLVAPDVQLHLVMLMYDDHGRSIIQEEGFMCYVNVSRPASRGTVLAKSPDPTVLPAVDPNFFADEADLRTVRDGLRLSREVIAQHAFDPYRGEEYEPGSGAVSDEALNRYIKDKCNSVYHPCGTCRMGLDDLAVVDDRLRVRGIRGLRIVDASIMPILTSCNTNAPAMMIGEKAAELIASDAA